MREFNYQTSLALQHELRPGFGVAIAYYRTDWKNQQAFVNRAVTPADFTGFCTTAPNDPRLGDVAGSRVCGLYDINPNRLCRFQIERVRYQDLEGRSGEPKEVYNGIDLSANARFGKGGVLMGGLGLGRTTFDYCWQNNLPHVYQVGTPGSSTINTVGPSASYRWFLRDPIGAVGRRRIAGQAAGRVPAPLGRRHQRDVQAPPGQPIPADWAATNADVFPCLGRNLSTNATSIALLPSAFNQGNQSSVLLDERINQIDLRVTKGIKIGKTRLQGSLELYNALNSRPAQGLISTFSTVGTNRWQFPTALLSGGWSADESSRQGRWNHHQPRARSRWRTVIEAGLVSGALRDARMPIGDAMRCLPQGLRSPNAGRR